MISFFGRAYALREPQNNCWHQARAAFVPVRFLRFTHLALLIAICVCAALNAKAQDQPAVSTLLAADSSSSSAPVPAPQAGTTTLHAGFATGQWQIADGYQYNRVYLRGTFKPFDTNGFNASVTRFFGRQFGVEGDLGAGFAPSSPGVSASSFFLGAGPHISFRGRGHFEPWVHGLVGVQHFDFGGVSFPGKTTSVAWIAGGGVDYRFSSGFGLRAEADYLGSHYGGALQRNFQIIAGVVWNF